MDECFFGLAGSERAPPPGAAHIPRVILVVIVVVAGAGLALKIRISRHRRTQQLTIKFKIKNEAAATRGNLLQMK
jgi:hypothetical protein